VILDRPIQPPDDFVEISKWAPMKNAPPIFALYAHTHRVKMTEWEENFSTSHHWKYSRDTVSV